MTHPEHDCYETDGADPAYKVPEPTRARLTKIQKRIIDHMAKRENDGRAFTAVYSGRRGTYVCLEYVATNATVIDALSSGKYPLIARIENERSRYRLTEWGWKVARP